MRQVNIGIAIKSPLIYAGLSSLIKSASDLNATIIDVSDDDLHQLAARRKISILIIDPLLASAGEITELKKSAGGKMKIAAIYHTALPSETIKLFDCTISIYDDIASLRETLRKLMSSSNQSNAQRELTLREQEIVKCVVRGLSNKEIADRINLSVNTVMTHRRNIAAKLQIHSPAGLTIYALVSKLVKLDEIAGGLKI